VTDFCRACGARKPPIPGEGTCAKCDPTGVELNRLRHELHSAVEALREIAAMRGTSKRQKVNCERAITWLYAHGYALEDGGYLPGKGFTEGVS